jgi:hypothetical protein
MLYCFANFHTFRQTLSYLNFNFYGFFIILIMKALPPFHTSITLTKQITAIHMKYIPLLHNSCDNCSQHNLWVYMTCRVNFDVNASWCHIHIEICKISNNYALVNIYMDTYFTLTGKSSIITTNYIDYHCVQIHLKRHVTYFPWDSNWA